MFDKSAPQSTAGKASVGFLILFFVLLAIGIFEATVLRQTGGNSIFDNLWLGIPMLGTGIAAIVSLITGVVAIWVQHERSILVFASTVMGAVVLIFVGGEVTFPH